MISVRRIDRITTAPDSLGDLLVLFGTQLITLPPASQNQGRVEAFIDLVTDFCRNPKGKIGVEESEAAEIEA